MYQERFTPILHILSPFEIRLMTDCLKKLDVLDDDLRFNSFATPFRELIRNILHRLAPDEEVRACSWFINEADTITRKQRVIYAIKGGLNDEFIQDELAIDISQTTANLRDVIDNLNRLTHINETYYNLKHDVALQMASDAIYFLIGVLEGIEETRTRIIEAYEARLHESITSAAIEDVINELDILATHYWVDGIEVEDISIVDITSKNIYILVNGNIEVTHQYGSDRDLARDDGFQVEEFYPFKVKTYAFVDDPLEVEITTDDIMVDNSSHFDNGDEEDEPDDYNDQPDPDDQEPDDYDDQPDPDDQEPDDYDD